MSGSVSMIDGHIDEVLKPCPFCGGESVLVPLSSCSGEIACIGECHFESAKYWDEPMTRPAGERRKWREIAIEAWNRRADT